MKRYLSLLVIVVMLMPYFVLAQPIENHSEELPVDEDNQEKSVTEDVYSKPKAPKMQLFGLQPMERYHMGEAVSIQDLIPNVGFAERFAGWMRVPIESKITKEDVNAQLSEPTSLALYNLSLPSLEGIQIFQGTNTGNLCLGILNNNLTNVDELAFLEEIGGINYNNNPISDFTGLSNIRRVGEINCYGQTGLDFSRVSNINFLSNLESTPQLMISNNNIRSLSPLQNLRHVGRLHVNNNNLTDLNGLQGLHSIEYLDIRNNKISDLTALSNITSLKDFQASGNPFKNLNGLEGITAIQGYWNIDYAQLNARGGGSLEDISALSNVKEISGILSLRANRIKQIPFDDLKSLTGELSLDNNYLTNLEFISGIGELGHLDVSGNFIADITPLTSIERADYIDLGWNIIPTWDSETTAVMQHLRDISDYFSGDDRGNQRITGFQSATIPTIPNTALKLAQFINEIDEIPSAMYATPSVYEYDFYIEDENVVENRDGALFTKNAGTTKVYLKTKDMDVYFPYLEELHQITVVWGPGGEPEPEPTPEPGDGDNENTDPGDDGNNGSGNDNSNGTEPPNKEEEEPPLPKPTPEPGDGDNENTDPGDSDNSGSGDDNSNGTEPPSKEEEELPLPKPTEPIDDDSKPIQPGKDVEDPDQPVPPKTPEPIDDDSKPIQPGGDVEEPDQPVPPKTPEPIDDDSKSIQPDEDIEEPAHPVSPKPAEPGNDSNEEQGQPTPPRATKPNITSIPTRPLVKEPSEFQHQDKPPTDQTYEKPVLPVLEKKPIGVVRGVIIDFLGRPLVGVRVELHSNPKVTVTDDQGAYEFTGVELGTHTLKAIYKGREIQSVKVTAQPEVKQLDDLVVSVPLTGEKPIQEINFNISFATQYGKWLPIVGISIVAGGAGIWVLILWKRCRIKIFIDRNQAGDIKFQDVVDVSKFVEEAIDIVQLQFHSSHLHKKIFIRINEINTEIVLNSTIVIYHKDSQELEVKSNESR